MNTNDAKEYLARREIPQLFESLLTGLMYYRPDDPIDYLEGCLKKARELGGPDKVRWDTFVGQEKKSLPPLNGGQSRRSLFRNVLPDSPNFPYRRYDRLPPISQFSIESDSDLSETAELIEEYEVFDPSRPRPKVILVIGGPGSGKGTQCLKIAERYGFQYVSVGELLRKKMIHNATSNRKWSLIAKIITNGELAPQETTITEIKQKIMKIPDANGIVIDGFPRDVGQALSFEDQICTPDLVVFLACTNHRLKERLQKRAEQQGRPDDNPKAIDRRLTNFKQNTIPLVKYFQERGLIVTLDADRDEEEVFCDISMTLDNKLFPSKEPAAGPSELDLSLLGETSSLADVACKYDEVEEEEEIGYAEGIMEIVTFQLAFCISTKKVNTFLQSCENSEDEQRRANMVPKSDTHQTWCRLFKTLSADCLTQHEDTSPLNKKLMSSTSTHPSAGFLLSLLSKPALLLLLICQTLPFYLVMKASESLAVHLPAL
ncbi:Adenylate kinase isoenzyme 5 [Larimichthys crocea]|uniref:Uncharacterized protein n=1 Tax=Larimichthys crocea TaxID=215358 RepID=A0ACD3QQZ6_LARCR|nr:Adenylate kinase isoenzyme 5 [Larimichthys crocea]